MSGNRVFLPRLPVGATDEGLRTHFSRFGEIIDCYIPVVPTTGKPKGMAFVTFSTDESAAAAVAQAMQQINGESCEVLKAAPRPDKRGGGGPIRREPEVQDPYLAGFLHAQSIMMGCALTPSMAPSMAPRERDPPRPAPRSRIFIRDVPDAFDDAVLQQYFQKFGEITDIYQPEYKDGETRKKKGIAYITFKAEQHVSACLAQGEMHTIQGMIVPVTRADPRREKERPAVPAWGGYDAPYRPSASAAPARSQSQGNRIFVGGIHPELSSEQVAEHFRHHGGDIADIYFPKDARTGHTRGFCYVTFLESLAVHRAVANAPREIHGYKIGEVKVAEARPGDDGGGSGGRGGARGGVDYLSRGSELGGGRARDRSAYDEGGGWGSGGVPMGYGTRNVDWGSGGSSVGMGGLPDVMPQNSADLMERLTPLMNLLAAAGAGGAYGAGAGNQQNAAYAAGMGGWAPAGGQVAGWGGSATAQRSHDASSAGRFRPY